MVLTDLVIGSDNTLYFGARDGNLYALNSLGKHKWKFNAGDVIFSSPVITKNGTIIFCCGDDRAGKYYGPISKMKGKNLGRLLAINKNGKKLWIKELKHGVNTSPIVDKDSVFYIVDNIGTYMSFDIKGNMLWTLDSNQDFDDASIYLGPEKILYTYCTKTITAVGNKD